MIEDWQINVEVRGALVKRFINTKLLHISTTNGCVLIKRGIKFSRNKIDEEHIPFILLKVEKDIKYIKRVKDFKINFNDWIKLDGRWINIKET